MSKSILFVDDEQKVLFGLRRTFRAMRNEWKMSFAKSGHDALNIMSKEKFDIIVTDVDMPGMGGIKLLEEVTKLYPATSRLTLSGRNEKETLLRSNNFIHQYISKPCDTETLKHVFTRTFMLHDLLLNHKFEKLVSQMQSLPTLPSLYDEILKKIESPEASLYEIGRLISRDISLSTKVLQVANTICSAVHHNIVNPADATIRIGLDIVKNLVLLNHVITQFDMAKLQELSINKLWNHSVTVGTYAKKIIMAEDLDDELKDYAFTAGLLHDVGKLIIGTGFTKEYSSAFTLTREENITISEAEKNIFGTTHAKVGAFLLGLWGLPEAIIDTVISHHNLEKNINKYKEVATAVHVADYLENESDTENKKKTVHKLDLDYLAEFGLTERLPIWRKVCHEGAFEEGDQQ